MPGYLDRIQPQPVDLRPEPMTSTYVAPWTREAREMARSDRQAIVRARDDYNRARVALNHIHLNTVLAKAEADQRAQLASYAMIKAREVDAIASSLCTGDRPALDMTIRQIEQGYFEGEVLAVFKRGAEAS